MYSNTSTIWEENFETTTGSALPAGWTSTPVEGTNNWVSVTSATGTPQAAPNGGNRKLRMFSTVNAPLRVAMLSTPSLDLSGTTAPLLSFWHAQRAITQINGNVLQDTLRVYYKTSTDGEWIFLREYADDIDWTESIIKLPEVSNDFYIGFKGLYARGLGIHLDNVRIFESSPNPQFHASNQLDFGALANNLPGFSIMRELAVTNTGSLPLHIEQAINGNPEISVESLTIAPGQTNSLQVTINPFGLPLGNYSENLVLSTNDPDNAEVTIAITATINEVFISDFIFEDFPNNNNGTFFNRWTALRIQGGNGFGVNNSWGLRTQGLNTANRIASIQSPYIRMGTNPKISFMYRVAANNNATAVAPAGSFTSELHISRDFGANWDIIPFNLDASTTNWNRLPITDISQYADEICLVKIVFNFVGSSGGITVWLDEISIGTGEENDLNAVSIRGSNMPQIGIAENYTVIVKNSGTTTQTAATYSVVLMRDDNIEIARLPGQEITALETKEFVFSWTPAATGAARLFAIVEYTNPLIDGDTTSFLNVNVMPADLTLIALGDGNDLLHLPVNMFNRRSVTQTLFFPHEILTNGGFIYALTYQSRFVSLTIGNTETDIQIWIGETDMEDLSDGWVNPETLTKVFDGAIRFSEGNRLDVNIPLDFPYHYNGGILVVHTFKNSGAFTNQDRFFGVSEENTARSRSYVTPNELNPGIIPPITGSGTNIIHGFPNTVLRMNLEGMGSVSGVVSNNGIPVENVRVQVVGTNLFVITGADGAYAFPHLIPGDYEIEVNKHGYFIQRVDVGIIAEESITKNIAIVPIPQYTVSGRVVANHNNQGIKGVKITLTGYDNYSATTDAGGYFSIPGVFDGFTYNIEASIDKYHTFNSTVEVNGNTVKNISLIEMAFQVHNPAAVVDGNNVLISWEAPGFRDRTFILDDGTFEEGWTFFGWTEISLGNRFVTDETGRLTGVDIYGIAHPDPNEVDSNRMTRIDIYDEDRNLIGSSEPFLMPANEWINVPLDNIPFSGTFYVMVKWGRGIDRTNHLGFDVTGPNSRENVGFVRTQSGNWSLVRDYFIQILPNQQNGVFSIRPNAQIHGQVPPAPVRRAASSLEGYIVFRLTEGSDEQDWVEIARVTQLEFVDTEWETLNEGIYQWAIVAKYADDNLSYPNLTNALMRTPTSIVSPNEKKPILVFPNPVIDVLRIQTEQVIKQIEIIDLTGRVLKTQLGNHRAIDMQHIPAGYYIVKIHTETAIVPIRIVKLN